MLLSEAQNRRQTAPCEHGFYIYHFGESLGPNTVWNLSAFALACLECRMGWQLLRLSSICPDSVFEMISNHIWTQVCYGAWRATDTARPRIQLKEPNQASTTMAWFHILCSCWNCARKGNMKIKLHSQPCPWEAPFYPDDICICESALLSCIIDKECGECDH